MKSIFESVEKLGFGLMRLPMLEPNKIDLDQTCQMADLFLESGFRYFDTAYLYNEGKSEEAAKACLVDRHPRESFLLATKLPMLPGATAESSRKCTEISLARTGAGYFDYYLLHSLVKENTERFEALGMWDFLGDLKKRGLARNIGFSFHDTPELLDQLLTKHPEVDFVQLQINYTDWERPGVESRRCYEVAESHDKPVIVMEPIKGGSLIALPDSVKKVFQDAAPDTPLAYWALGYAASLEQVAVVLSGMSNLEQLQENISFMKGFKGFEPWEKTLVDEAAQVLATMDVIPCTNCRYCMKDCPISIQIPEILSLLNKARSVGVWNLHKDHYMSRYSGPGSRASDCIGCNQCVEICPQHLDVPEFMKVAANLYE